MVDITIDNIIAIWPIILAIVFAIFTILVAWTIQYGGIKDFLKPTCTKADRYWLFWRFFGEKMWIDLAHGNNEDIADLQELRKTDPELYKDTLEFYDKETRKKVEELF